MTLYFSPRPGLVPAPSTASSLDPRRTRSPMLLPWTALSQGLTGGSWESPWHKAHPFSQGFKGNQRLEATQLLLGRSVFLFPCLGLRTPSRPSTPEARPRHCPDDAMSTQQEDTGGRSRVYLHVKHEITQYVSWPCSFSPSLPLMMLTMAMKCIGILQDVQSLLSSCTLSALLIRAIMILDQV